MYSSVSYLQYVSFSIISSVSCLKHVLFSSIHSSNAFLSLCKNDMWIYLMFKHKRWERCNSFQSYKTHEPIATLESLCVQYSPSSLVITQTNTDVSQSSAVMKSTRTHSRTFVCGCYFTGVEKVCVCVCVCVCVYRYNHLTQATVDSSVPRCPSSSGSM